MTLTIRQVPDEPGIVTDLYIDPTSGELLALDDDGYDRMGLADRAFVRDYLTQHGKLAKVPVYVDPTTPPAPSPAPNI